MGYNFILEVPSNINNKGDAAIVRGNLTALLHKFPTSKIIICYSKHHEHKHFFNKDQKTSNRLFDNIENRKVPLFFKMLVLIFKSFQYLIWIKFKRIPIDEQAKNIFNLYENSDIIIYTGGGYLGGPYWSLSSVLLPIYFAKKLKKKVCLTGVTIEPPKNFLLRILIKKILNKIDLITAREPFTIEVLNSLKIKSLKFLTADYAFLNENGSKENGYELLDKLKILNTNSIRIGISLKQFPKSEISTQNLEIYQRKITKAVELLLKKFDSIILFFPFDITPTQDDRIIANSIVKILDKPLQERVFLLNDNYSTEDIMSMISTMDVFIATRFHSIIFAVSMEIPTISLPYMQKNHGLMKMLKLDDWMLNFPNFTSEQLVEYVSKILENKEQVKSILKNRLITIRKDAYSNITAIEVLLKKNQIQSK